MLPFPPRLPLLPPVSRLAVAALNALLAREPWAGERLARHAGKTVCFAWGRQRLPLTIASDGKVSEADEAIVPDVTLTFQSDKFDLSRLLRGGGLPDFAELTHISGDAGLAQVVGELARDLRWDPEDDLARMVGDIPATRLMAFAHAAKSGAREASGRLAANLAEYLAQESGTLAGKPTLQQQRLDIESLQADTDALARRISALEARLNAHPGARHLGARPQARFDVHSEARPEVRSEACSEASPNTRSETSLDAHASRAASRSD